MIFSKINIIPFDSLHEEPVSSVIIDSSHVPRRNEMIRWDAEEALYKGIVHQVYWDFSRTEVDVFVRDIEPI